MILIVISTISHFWSPTLANFCGSLYLYPYFPWYILPLTHKYLFLWGANFFYVSCSYGLGRFQISSIKPSMTNHANHVNPRTVDGKITCFMYACQPFTLLLGNFLFENFPSVQVSIETLKKVFTTVW